MSIHFSHIILLILIKGTGIAEWYGAGLRAAWSGVRVPTGSGNFSLHHRVQTGSGAHPAFYPMGFRGYFSESKVAGVVKLTTHLRLMPRCVELCPHSSNTPPCRGGQLKKVQGQILLNINTKKTEVTAFRSRTYLLIWHISTNAKYLWNMTWIGLIWYVEL
jgi:hypothetical protein